MAIDVKTILSNTYAGATGVLANPTGFAAINTAKFGSIAGATGATGVVEIGNLAQTAGVQGRVSIFGSLRVGGATGVAGATGSIQATNDITAYFSSDIRFKENIVEISDALRKVENIRGVTFDWKNDRIQDLGGEDGYFVRKKDVGVIAQEIEAILPEIVATRPDGSKAVRYEKLSALLIEAIKELSAKNKELEFKINSLIQ